MAIVLQVAPATNPVEWKHHDPIANPSFPSPLGVRGRRSRRRQVQNHRATLPGWVGKQTKVKVIILKMHSTSIHKQYPYCTFDIAQKLTPPSYVFDFNSAFEK